MKFYVLLFSFFLLNNTQGALIETNLSDLPVELLYNIFELMPFSRKDYKNMIVSNFFYHLLHNYMLEKQNTLLSKLSKNEINKKIKKQIVFNNRLLLGYLRNQKKDDIYDEVITLKNWNHGKLMYYLGGDYSTIYYSPSRILTNPPKEDATKEIPLFARTVGGEKISPPIKGNLYDVKITHKLYTTKDQSADFLELDPMQQEQKKSNNINKKLRLCNEIKNKIGNFNSNSINPYEFSNDREDIDLKLDSDFDVNCEIQTKDPDRFLNIAKSPYFLEPVRLYNCLGAVKIISPIKSINYILGFVLFPNKSPLSLSLFLSINPGTKKEDFIDIRSLDGLKKLTLCFLENNNSNKNVDIICPPGLGKLILKDCCVTIHIPPSSLKNLEIISPKEGCKIKIVKDFGLAFILNQEKKLTSLHIKNDKNNYLKNILQNLEIDQPQNTIIENCAYDQLTPRFNKFESLLLK